MARATATLDPFAALAEPRRRKVLETLSKKEQSVNELVRQLGWPQPQVSKHLAVLRQVELVILRQAGRQRLYRINGAPMKQIHDWTSTFERFWSRQLLAIKQHAENS